jgi:hypothetical protein
MNLLYVVLGALLLMWGRKLFWLFVAIAGFLLAYQFIPGILSGQPQSVIWIASILIGIAGAALTIFIQKFTVGLAGLAAGAFVAYYLLEFVAVNLGEYQWMAILVGGIIGALLAGSMFDWALILVTSASGAALVSHGLDLKMPISAAVLLVLFIAGLIGQIKIKAKE